MSRSLRNLESWPTVDHMALSEKDRDGYKSRCEAIRLFLEESTVPVSCDHGCDGRPAGRSLPVDQALLDQALGWTDLRLSRGDSLCQIQRLQRARPLSLAYVRRARRERRAPSNSF